MDMEANQEQVDQIARSAQELWVQGYLTDIWRHLRLEPEAARYAGPVSLQWDDLAEKDKEDARGAIRAMLRIMQYAGYRLEPIAQEQKGAA